MTTMDKLKQKFYEKAQALQKELQLLKEKHGDTVVADVTINQILTGMKGVPSLLTLTSKLDPVEGIRFRGYSIPELQELLPKAEGGSEPLPEGLFYLMLFGELPTAEEVRELSEEWTRRVYVPHHVYRAIDALPKASRPMTKFSCGILAWATESKFQKAYRKGISKVEYWDTTYEDVMNFIAGLPRIAAYIYRKDYKDGDHISPDPNLDWSANFAHMMGYDSDEVKKLFRLYLFIHADHEGGNVSAHTTHLVGSALSNCYYSFAAGMLGLAGPLHGYANQEVIVWIKKMIEEIGDEDPSKEKIAEFVHSTLSKGQVVPGYGHAVLRKTDPRFTAQQDFAEKYVKNDNYVNIVNKLHEVVPPILGDIGKIKNPWPNVDAYSGSLLNHFGITEYSFYTVLFGVSRALGILSQSIWDRALGLPIERPSSYTFDWFKEKAGMA
jgi:citrate synthase